MSWEGGHVAALRYAKSDPTGSVTILVGTHRSGPPGTRRWCVSSCAQRRKDWYYGQDWYETWLSYEQPDWTLEQSSQALYQITTEICGWHARIEDWTVADQGAAPAQVRVPTRALALAHSVSTPRLTEFSDCARQV